MNRSAQPGVRRVAFNASLPESSEAFFNSKHRDVINSVEESIKRHSATSSKVMRKFATQQVKFLSVPDSITMTDETISHLCGLGLSRYYTLEYINSQNPDLVYFLEGYMTILASFCTIAGIDEHSCPLAMKDVTLQFWANHKFIKLVNFILFEFEKLDTRLWHSTPRLGLDFKNYNFRNLLFVFFYFFLY